MHRQPGVDQDLAGDLTLGGHGGQHRHPGRLVVVLVAHRQRPGVRRRPEEDDQEHHQCRPLDGAGHRGPADHHRHAAGRPAPHHVLRGAAFEQQRVDEDVERDRGHGQHAGQQVRRPRQPAERGDREHQTEDQRVPRRDRGLGQRAASGALHHLVDVGVGHTVERVGAGRGQHAADQGVEDQQRVNGAAVCQQHRRNGGDQQQLDHTRLGQRQIRQRWWIVFGSAPH